MFKDLSILDFGFRAHAVQIAEAAERWGYHRLWLGEHHSELQCNNPLLLGALLVAATQDLRLGSGGVCLDYQSPIRIAEDARLIESIAPNRFDLGVTRGMKVYEPRGSALLDGRPVPTSATFEARLRDVHAWVTRRFPPGHPMSSQPWPLEQADPPLWVLATSLSSARLAAELGLGFCYSLHHTRSNVNGIEVLAAYRYHFKPSPEFPQPVALLVVSGICASTEAEARGARRRLELQLLPEQLGKLDLHQLLVGSPEHWCEGLQKLAQDYNIDEIMVLDLLGGDLGERLDMFSLLAQCCGLRPRTQTSGNEFNAQ